jgi:hypothetical protein
MTEPTRASAQGSSEIPTYRGEEEEEEEEVVDTLVRR